MSDVMQVPVIVEGKEFYRDRTDRALADCQQANYKAVFMPQVVDSRISAPKENRLWQTWWTAPSIRATGRTRQGNPVVVYAHITNYVSNPDNITSAIEQGLINGAGIMPHPEFLRLLDSEDGKQVFVVDYNALKASPSGVIALSKALKHPQTNPFLGGKERAERYLDKHKEIYGERIGIWHSDDLHEQSVVRLLFLGNDDNFGLGGSSNLDNNGRFLGVSQGSVQRAQNSVPLETLLKLSPEFVPPFAQAEFEQRVRALQQ